MKRTFLIILIILGQAAFAKGIVERLVPRVQSSLNSYPQKGTFRILTAGAIMEGKNDEARKCMQQYIQAKAEQTNNTFTGTELKNVYPAACGFYLLAMHKLNNEVKIDDDTVKWLFASDSAMSLFADTVNPTDNFGNMLTIINTLYKYNPELAKKYRNLILAISCVADQRRHPMHQQMGSMALSKPYPEPLEIYKYYVKLFSSDESKHRYRDLSVNDLIFVVDIQVPISELLWSLKNVSGNTDTWYKKFDDVDYDHQRIANAQYIWPHGEYTMEKMLKVDGICVDQAYYSVISARANGIPAMIFTGQGKRGPHAWFGYMKKSKSWILDSGRYKYDNYATGYTYNPQTNAKMTDHDLEYFTNKSLHSRDYSYANRYFLIAHVYYILQNYDAAVNVAKSSIDKVNIYNEPWVLIETIYKKEKKTKELLGLYKSQKKVFQKYKDYVAEITAKMADLYAQQGDHETANKMLDQKERQLGNSRDDLTLKLMSQQVDNLTAVKDYKGARKEIEKYLKKNQREGSKIIPTIRYYLNYTKKTNQTGDAVKFVKSYTNTLLRLYPAQQTKVVVYQLLYIAYKNDNNEKEAAKVTKKLERL